mgnify:CR=1 FL=1
MEISDALNEVLSGSWRQKRGIEVFSVNINSLSIPDDQRKKLTEWEENAMTTNPNTAAARLVGGQIDSMKAAASNSGGAMTGFMGMGMAMNAGGGMNAQNLFAMGQQQAQAAPQQAQAGAANTWTWFLWSNCERQNSVRSAAQRSRNRRCRRQAAGPAQNAAPRLPESSVRSAEHRNRQTAGPVPAEL